MNQKVGNNSVIAWVPVSGHSQSGSAAPSHPQPVAPVHITVTYTVCAYFHTEVAGYVSHNSAETHS